MNLRYREAVKNDIFELVKLLADDELGSTREDLSLPINKSYLLSFDQITNDKNNELIVVEKDNKIIGMLQLTFIPYLTHIGTLRCLIEGVRINSNYRGDGLGTLFFKWAINRAKEKNCSIVQLTSNKQRESAINFYKNLGFINSHEGFKLNIN